MPAIRRVQLAGRLKMFGDQCRVLLHRAGRTLLDRDSQGRCHRRARISAAIRRPPRGSAGAEGVLDIRGEASSDRSVPRPATRRAPDRYPARPAAPPEAGDDHRRRGQRPLGLVVQPVDTRSMAACTVAGTRRRRHRRRRIASAAAGQHAALDQLAHISSAKNGFPGCPLGDDRRQLPDRGIRPQQLTDQRRDSPNHPVGQAVSSARQCTPVNAPVILGARGNQHHRLGLWNDGKEVGQHRLADRIDPVRILEM